MIFFKHYLNTFKNPGKTLTSRDIIVILLIDILNSQGTATSFKSGCEPGRTGELILVRNSHDKHQNVRNKGERNKYHRDYCNRNEPFSRFECPEVFHHPYNRENPKDRRQEYANSWVK